MSVTLVGERWTRLTPFASRRLNVPPTDDTEGADLHGMLDELSALDEADLEKQLSELEEKNPAAREADEYSDDEEAKAHSFRAESATDTFNTYSCQRALGKVRLSSAPSLENTADLALPRFAF